MQKLLAASLVAAGVLLAGAAQANADLAKAQCGKCHEMDKKKKGPSYKQTAADYKGKADAEATLFKKITDPKGDHPEMKATPDETRTVLKWILQQ
jgi:cytochrome c